MISRVVSVFIGLVAVVSYPIAAECSGDAASTIQWLHEQHVPAVLRARDIEALMDVYAEDAISQPPGQPALIGRQAIGEMWVGVLAAYDVEVVVEVEEIEVAGVWAFERGRYRMRLTPRDGEVEILDEGKYLDILREVDGEWKYWRVTWNSSLAPSE
jgi:ketosteroid isomerase-like protein